MALAPWSRFHGRQGPHGRGWRVLEVRREASERHRTSRVVDEYQYLWEKVPFPPSKLSQVLYLYLSIYIYIYRKYWIEATLPVLNRSPLLQRLKSGRSAGPHHRSLSEVDILWEKPQNRHFGRGKWSTTGYLVLDPGSKIQQWQMIDLQGGAPQL